MAENEGYEAEEQLVQDLLAKVNDSAEKLKKSMEEPRDVKRGDEGYELDIVRPVKDEFMNHFAELVMATVKPQHRETVIEALEKEAKCSEDYAWYNMEVGLKYYREFLNLLGDVIAEILQTRKRVSQQENGLKDDAKNA